MTEAQFIEVTSENVADVGIYCIRNKNAPGFQAKLDWFRNEITRGLKIVIAADKAGKQLGFIEYLPSENAWRPVRAENYLFIQCIALFVKNARGTGVASRLLELCESDAKSSGKSGVCAMTSDGVWIADKTIYRKNGYAVIDRSGRFELVHKQFIPASAKPALNDWEKQQKKYRGWNIVYSDQCPWHENAVRALLDAAKKNGVDLRIRKLNDPKQAQRAPSGFGTFSLINDGKLLADHYISKTRFESILRQELK